MNNESESKTKVLVMFPGSRQVTKVDSPEHRPVTEQFFEDQLELQNKDFDDNVLFENKVIAQDFNQITESLENRLNVLNEVQSRLKFYLDDIESSAHIKSKRPD